MLNIIFLGLVSFFTDLSTEMVSAVPYISFWSRIIVDCGFDVDVLYEEHAGKNRIRSQSGKITNDNNNKNKDIRIAVITAITDNAILAYLKKS